VLNSTAGPTVYTIPKHNQPTRFNVRARYGVPLRFASDGYLFWRKLASSRNASLISCQ